MYILAKVILTGWSELFLDVYIYLWNEKFHTRVAPCPFQIFWPFFTLAFREQLLIVVIFFQVPKPRNNLINSSIFLRGQHKCRKNTRQGANGTSLELLDSQDKDFWEFWETSCRCGCSFETDKQDTSRPVDEHYGARNFRNVRNLDNPKVLHMVPDMAEWFLKPLPCCPLLSQS